MDDRRKRQRAGVHFNVSAEYQGQWYNDLHTEDISMSGMRLFSPLALPVETVFALLLILEEGEVQARIFIQAKVVRLGAMQEQGWELGLHFLGMDSDSSIHLFRLIRHHL